MDIAAICPLGTGGREGTVEDVHRLQCVSIHNMVRTMTLCDLFTSGSAYVLGLQ